MNKKIKELWNISATGTYPYDHLFAEGIHISKLCEIPEDIARAWLEKHNILLMNKKRKATDNSLNTNQWNNKQYYVVELNEDFEYILALYKHDNKIYIIKFVEIQS